MLQPTEPVMGGKSDVAVEFWANRHETWKEENNEVPWTELYWNSYQRPYRVELRDAIAKAVHAPLSILEVGCNSGPNLRLWREQWPEVMLHGCDLNSEAIRASQEYFSDDSKVKVWQANLLQGTNVPNVDVIVSCFSLAYMSPEGLEKLLDQCWNAARVALVILEPMTDSIQSQVSAKADGVAVHDYTEILRRVTGDGANLEWTALTPASAGDLTHILTASKIKG